MYDTKSDYALNKLDPDAIVCKSVTGVHTRLTREDFDTEADFLKWKAWSDESYHIEEKGNHALADHTLPLDELPDSAAAPEIVIEQRIERTERERYSSETVIRIKGQLTEKQFHRLWLYCAEGMTEREIAEQERVTQGRISESITAALKKIKRVVGIRRFSDR